HPSVTGKATISVHTLEGRSVRSISPSPGSISTPVDLSTLPAGTYLLKYQSESGSSETFRILKQ
ncbi:MAG TPA: T9SS type A sorting domain-containing protein, partial [Flavisolibacter sp.]|nr:T9SS type A sorting domain-containing protein [Flavisolibacter sp.]